MNDGSHVLALGILHDGRPCPPLFYSTHFESCHIENKRRLNAYSITDYVNDKAAECTSDFDAHTDMADEPSKALKSSAVESCKIESIQLSQAQKLSVHQVFNTTELLENILISLPRRDLLLSQRVNKTFSETIGHPINLQRALFLRPVTSTNPRDPIRNALLGDLVFEVSGKHFLVLPPTVGPLDGSPHSVKVEVYRLRTMRERKRYAKRRIFTIGAWKDMYLSQPATPIYVKFASRWRYEEAMTLSKLLEFLVKQGCS